MTDTPTDPAADGSNDSDPRSRKWWIVGGIAAALVVLAGVAVWYFVFRDTAPPPVDVEKAAESAGANGATSTTGDTALSGTWKVDTSIGSFDDFSSAFVGYRVNEELAGVGAKTAAGRTPDVSGTLVVDGTTVTTVDIEADLSTLESDESFRDASIRNQALETATFPTANFTLTEPIELGSIPGENETVKADATGELTLHGVTRTVTIPLEAKRVGDVIAVTGSLDIAFADYGIAKPVAARVLSIEDRGVMELQLFFSKP